MYCHCPIQMSGNNLSVMHENENNIYSFTKILLKHQCYPERDAIYSCEMFSVPLHSGGVFFYV